MRHAVNLVMCMRLEICASLSFSPRIPWADNVHVLMISTRSRHPKNRIPTHAQGTITNRFFSHSFAGTYSVGHDFSANFLSGSGLSVFDLVRLTHSHALECQKLWRRSIVVAFVDISFSFAYQFNDDNIGLLSRPPVSTIIKERKNTNTQPVSLIFFRAMLFFRFPLVLALQCGCVRAANRSHGEKQKESNKRSDEMNDARLWCHDRMSILAKAAPRIKDTKMEMETTQK